MFENFFLTFVNRPFNEGKGNIRIILAEIANELPRTNQPKKGWDVFMADTVSFLIDKGVGVIPEFKQAISEAYRTNTAAIGPLESAFEAVFGNLGRYCETKCPLRYGRELLLSEAFFNKQELTCLECEQAYFSATLERFINTVVISSQAIYHDTQGKFFDIESEIKEIPSCWPYGTIPDFDAVGRQFLLQNFISAHAGYSLNKYLHSGKNQKVRLKRCPYCSTFFISKNIAKHHCYGEICEREYQRIKKAKQRETDPVRYVT
ncbi:MAG: hypothetical protein AB1461_15275 [Thermodesulfobacteriota bacterium]